METIYREQRFGFDDDGNGDDRARLRRFVGDVRSLLNGLVEEGLDRYGDQLFYEDLRGAMREAWFDVQPQFEIVDQRIQEVPEHVLQEHGLTGSQLRFKFGVIAKKFRQFWQNGGREILKWLLEAIDNVLDSIFEAIGAGGAIKEIKEGIKHAILD